MSSYIVGPTVYCNLVGTLVTDRVAAAIWSKTEVESESGLLGNILYSVWGF